MDGFLPVGHFGDDVFAPESGDVVHHRLAVEDDDVPGGGLHAVVLVDVGHEYLVVGGFVEPAAAELRDGHVALDHRALDLELSGRFAFDEGLPDDRAESRVVLGELLYAESLHAHRCLGEERVMDGYSVEESRQGRVADVVDVLVDDLVRRVEIDRGLAPVDAGVVEPSPGGLVLFRGIGPAAVLLGPTADYFLFLRVARRKAFSLFVRLCSANCSAENGCLDISSTSFWQASEYALWESPIYFLSILYEGVDDLEQVHPAPVDLRSVDEPLERLDGALPVEEGVPCRMLPYCHGYGSVRKKFHCLMPSCHFL